MAKSRSTYNRSRGQFKRRHKGSTSVGSDVRKFPKFKIDERSRDLRAIFPTQGKKITRAKNSMLKATTTKKQNAIYGKLIVSLNKGKRRL